MNVSSQNTTHFLVLITLHSLVTKYLRWFQKDKELKSSILSPTYCIYSLLWEPYEYVENSRCMKLELFKNTHILASEEKQFIKCFPHVNNESQKRFCCSWRQYSAYWTQHPNLNYLSGLKRQFYFIRKIKWAFFGQRISIVQITFITILIPIIILVGFHCIECTTSPMIAHKASGLLKEQRLRH